MIKIFKIFLVLDLVVLNLGVGYLVYKSVTQFFSPVEVAPVIKTVETQTQLQTQLVDKCGTDCQMAIAQALAKIPTPAVVVNQPTVTVQPTAGKKKVRKEEILTIPGSGSSILNAWQDLAGTNFYFDTRDYPGLVEVYFEANMRLLNGNGLAYVRLYDGTNNIGVNGSDNSTASQTDVWAKSQRVYFWAGKNLIRVQAKSLTADTVVYNQGRLRIVVEN